MCGCAEVSTSAHPRSASIGRTVRDQTLGPHAKPRCLLRGLRQQHEFRVILHIEILLCSGLYLRGRQILHHQIVGTEQSRQVLARSITRFDVSEPERIGVQIDLTAANDLFLDLVNLGMRRRVCLQRVDDREHGARELVRILRRRSV